MALSVARAMDQHTQDSPKLPLLEGLQPLYDLGVYPRQGHLIMVAGRSGSMKSSFALWFVESLGLDCLYFSADMSASQASLKLAALRMQRPTDEVERMMLGDERGKVLEALEESRVKFSFKSPIRFDDIIAELNAWVTLYNRYPTTIVFDNLQDFDGAESEYSEQMFALSAISDISRQTGATTLLLHHASDKSWEADSRPYRPPSRKEVKGGMSEKPELSLGVAVNNETDDFHIAPIKNRMGFQNPTGDTFATLRVKPEMNLFYSPRMEHYAVGNGA